MTSVGISGLADNLIARIMANFCSSSEFIGLICSCRRIYNIWMSWRKDLPIYKHYSNIFGPNCHCVMSPENDLAILLMDRLVIGLIDVARDGYDEKRHIGPKNSGPGPVIEILSIITKLDLLDLDLLFYYVDYIIIGANQQKIFIYKHGEKKFIGPEIKEPPEDVITFYKLRENRMIKQKEKPGVLSLGMFYENDEFILRLPKYDLFTVYKWLGRYRANIPMIGPKYVITFMKSEVSLPISKNWGMKQYFARVVFAARNFCRA